MTTAHSFHRQRGAALVVGLIVLVMMTLMILSAVMMSTGGLKAVGNMQFRDEAIAAANVAVEQVVSTDFMNLPTPQTVSVDLNPGGTAVYSVSVPAPTCVSWRIIPSSELDITNPADQPCILGTAAAASGLSGAAGTNSFCADTLWQVRAIVCSVNNPDCVAGVASQATGASVTIDQGISKRMSMIVAANSCD